MSGLRWRRGDTEAFNALNTAGEGVLSAYDQYLAGQAYRDATQVTNPDAASAAAYNQQAIDQGGPQGERDSWDYQPGGDGANDANQAERTAFTQSASDAADRAGKYSVGLGANRTEYNAAPTRQQIRLAGAQGLEAHYAGRGDVANALRYGTMGDTMQANEQQRALGGLQIDAAKDAAKVRALELKREATRDDVISNYTKAKDAASKGDFGPLKEIVGTEYNNHLPGLADGKTLHFIGDTSIAQTDEKGFGQTRPLDSATAIKLLDAGLSQRLAAISSKDWQHEREFELKRGEKESLEDYRKRSAANAEAETSRKAAQDRLEWGVDGKGGARERLANIAAGARGYQTTKWDPIGEDEKGRMVWKEQGTVGLHYADGKGGYTPVPEETSAKVWKKYTGTPDAKPQMTIKDYVAAFPPGAGETEEAVVRRYNKTFGPKAAAAGGGEKVFADAEKEGKRKLA